MRGTPVAHRSINQAKLYHHKKVYIVTTSPRDPCTDLPRPNPANSSLPKWLKRLPRSSLSMVREQRKQRSRTSWQQHPRCCGALPPGHGGGQNLFVPMLYVHCMHCMFCEQHHAGETPAACELFAVVASRPQVTPQWSPSLHERTRFHAFDTNAPPPTHANPPINTHTSSTPHAVLQTSQSVPHCRMAVAT